MVLRRFISPVKVGVVARTQELCESRGGRPGLPSLVVLNMVSVDVKQF